MNFGLRYVGVSGVELQGYASFDWVGTMCTKSKSRCCFSLQSTMILWYIRKHKSVALSSVEVEYMAISMASCEVAWLRKMPIRIFGLEMGPIMIHYDN